MTGINATTADTKKADATTYDLLLRENAIQTRRRGRADNPALFANRSALPLGSANNLALLRNKGRVLRNKGRLFIAILIY